jgi:hypothetical protein
MNINHISCHHFWIDPESTLRSHKLRCCTPKESKAFAGSESAHVAHSNKLSDARRQAPTRERDFNFISPVSMFTMWCAMRFISRSRFVAFLTRQSRGLIINATHRFAAFDLRVKRGNLYDNGSRSRHWKSAG